MTAQAGRAGWKRLLPDRGSGPWSFRPAVSEQRLRLGDLLERRYRFERLFLPFAFGPPAASGPQVQVHLPTFPFTAFGPRPKPAFVPEHGFRPASNSPPLSDLGSRPVASGPLLLVRVFRDLLPSASCPQLPARGSGPAASGSLRPAATDPRFPSRSFHPAASGPQLQAHGLQRSPASGPDAGGPRLQVHHGLKLRPASPGWLLPARVGRPAPIGTNDADLRPGWPRQVGNGIAATVVRSAGSGLRGAGPVLQARSATQAGAGRIATRIQGTKSAARPRPLVGPARGAPAPHQRALPRPVWRGPRRREARGARGQSRAKPARREAPHATRTTAAGRRRSRQSRKLRADRAAAVTVASVCRGERQGQTGKSFRE